MNPRIAIALLASVAGLVASPAAAQETEMKFMADIQPAEGVDSQGTGMADVTLDPDSMTLRWQMVYDGLTGEPVAAHFHGPAEPGETAPPVIDMTTDIMGDELTDEPLPTDIMAGSAELTEEQIADFQAGMWYINIHTEQYPDGEIRGQVVEGEADAEAMGVASE